jgi:hypothetical protein
VATYDSSDFAVETADSSEINESPDSLPDAPTDSSLEYEMETELQISEAAERLSGIQELRPERWGALDAGQRLAILQDVENTMASVQRRPPVPIATESIGANTFGGFDPATGGITINADHLSSDMSLQEHLDTIIHEGRHAFQQFAILNPDAVADSHVTAEWAENMANYLTPDLYGQEAYAGQPVEADASSYASRITSMIRGRTSG